MYSPALQAAGHIGSMQDESGELFIKPNAHQQELNFYRDVIYTMPDLQAITWPLYGILTEQELDVSKDQDVKKVAQDIENNQDWSKLRSIAKSTDDPERPTLILQNATKGFKAPSIMDVKLGSLLYDVDSASQDKIDRLKKVSETTTSGSMGMRLAGMTVWDPQTQKRTSYDKFYGRSITEHNAVHSFDKFFAPGLPIEIKNALCERFVIELKDIRQVLLQTEIRMISSSLLFVYESDVDAFMEELDEYNTMMAQLDEDDEDEDNNDDLSASQKLENLNNLLFNGNTKSKDNQNGDDDHDSDSDSDNGNGNGSATTSSRERGETPFNVRLIDFAHSKATPGQGPDYDVLKGINSLIELFNELYEKSSHDE